MNEKGLQVLARNFLIPLEKYESLFSCDHCLVGKQHRVSFNNRSKKLKKLELEYSNVCGRMFMATLEEIETSLPLLMMLSGRY